MALTRIKTGGVTDSAITSAKIGVDVIVAEDLASNSITAAEITDNVVSADELAVTGDGTTSQFLRSDGDGTFTWAAPTAPAITAITGAAANQILTDDGDATVTSESGLTFDGNTLDISYGGTGAAHSIVVGADDNATSRTNNTNKYFQMGIANYENAEEVNGIFYASSGDTTAKLYIGGAGGSQNAFTELKFYTGSDPQSTSATEHMRIKADGKFLIGSSMQLKEIGRGIIDQGESGYQPIYSVGGDFDGNMLIFSHLTNGAGHGMFIAHSANGGEHHAETHISNSSIGFQWSGDSLTLQQTAGTAHIEWVIYQMDEDH